MKNKQSYVASMAGLMVGFGIMASPPMLKSFLMALSPRVSPHWIMKTLSLVMAIAPAIISSTALIHFLFPPTALLFLITLPILKTSSAESLAPASPILTVYSRPLVQRISFCSILTVLFLVPMSSWILPGRLRPVRPIALYLPTVLNLAPQLLNQFC